jgi:hypothetical protein
MGGLNPTTAQRCSSSDLPLLLRSRGSCNAHLYLRSREHAHVCATTGVAMTWHVAEGTRRSRPLARNRENTQVAKPNDLWVLARKGWRLHFSKGRQRERGATCGQLSAMRLLAVPAGLPHVELLERCVENLLPFRQLTACGVLVEYKCSCRVTHLSCCALCLLPSPPAARTCVAPFAPEPLRVLHVPVQHPFSLFFLSS